MHLVQYGATIDSTTGKFVWTPSKSYGSYEDVIYNFDIIVNVEDKEDRENISITVKKAYDEPEIEPKVEPEIEPKVEPEDRTKGRTRNRTKGRTRNRTKGRTRIWTLWRWNKINQWCMYNR